MSRFKRSAHLLQMRDIAKTNSHSEPKVKEMSCVEMKNRKLAYIRDYILLLFVVVCLVTAGLMISNIVVNSTINHVNPAEYSVKEDTGVLSDKQIDVYNRILDAVEAGSDMVPVTQLMDYEKNEIAVQLGLHYGTMEGAFDLISWGDGTAILNLDLFRQFGEQKSVIDARVDEAVSNICEGSDRFKLWQICQYLANRIDYTDGVRDTIDGLNGQGVCCTYAMLFYKMATRIGIQTYICYGFTDDSPDSYHSWNMVEIDGERYHYDPTWYDNIVSDFRYVHSETPWGRSFTINRI